MNRYFSLTICALMLSLTACVDEDFFGLASNANIKTIEVTNQASTARIDNSSLQVSIEMPAGVDLSATTVRALTLSTFATSTINEGDVIDFRDTVTFTVTAEDGSENTWSVIPLIATQTPQLDNSDFNLWYQASGGYFEPGESAANTIWGTGNPGTQILGLLTTTPLEIAEGNLVPLMETLDNGSLAGTFGFPISAGTIYTGTFDTDAIDPANPEAAIDFGVPFAARPSAFRLKYSYQPGPENKDRDGNVLGFGDTSDIYCLLEVRANGQVFRLATAWFRTGESVSSLTDLTVPFTYGRLGGEFPPYTMPDNDLYVEGDSANVVLSSHLTFVATSSSEGATFQGAVGSTLQIDDLELVYE